MACALWGFSASAQQTVTIKGNVKFPDKDFKISVYQRQGFDRKVLAETTVGDDHTYCLEVPVEKVGEATVDCGRWQDVNVWLDDENMDIDFRGMDTAKVKIKNPPYVYIHAGKKNDLMNLINFTNYRNYQGMIAASENVYKANIEDKKVKSDLFSAFYQTNGENSRAWLRYLVEHDADQPSVLAAIKRLNLEKDSDVINPALAHLESLSPEYKQLVTDYRQAEAEAKAKRERMAEGQPAPELTFQNEKGKTISLKKTLKGKITIIDFWASWCGPCRKEIPNVKKYYAEYKDKGVQFLSISIDSRKDAWTRALKEENMGWMQGWTPDSGKAAMDTYQFNGIPFILMIDKEGKIYRKHLRGEAIKKAIDECLGNK